MIAPGNDNNAIAAVTGLILEIFRLNGRLLEAGDHLVAPIGLTSARWQVLGAIDAAQTPQPVAHLARDMGLSRQAVQRLANEMEEAGIIQFTPNPHHERAKLVLMTSRGESLFKAAMRVQRLWAKSLSEGLDGERMNRAADLLRSLRAKLERT